MEETPAFNYSFGGCYKRDSFDSRCCGLCYSIKRHKINQIKDQEELNKITQIHLCPISVCDFTDSCYFNTYDDCLCTAVCCPIKFPLFFVCFLGSIVNHCVNCSCLTNRNYLC